jgi:hypothetical protein
MFSFTYVYNRYDLLIPFLRDKCSHRALFDAPIKTNPAGVIGTDIKTWFAAYHVKTIGLLDKKKFNLAINTTAAHISQVIIGQEVMLKMRTESALYGKEAIKQYQKSKAKSINRRKDYEAQKDIEKTVVKNAKERGENPGSAHTVAKAMVKIARNPKVYASARKPRQARKGKKPR